MKRALYIFLLFLFPFFSLRSARAQAISPLDYGLLEAASGMGRYFALYNAHVDALYRGVAVDYSGIDSLDIELPPAWKSIPLGPYTDFGGLVLTVTNHAHHGALFSLTQSAVPLELDKRVVDGLDFGGVPELAVGHHLLVLEDQTPWTERRGYGYQQYRRDLIVVHDGKGVNAPVASWNTEATNLKAYCYAFDPGVVSVVRNLTMHRAKGCTFRTGCLAVSGMHAVRIEHVRVTTPRSRMIADGVFSVNNSAAVQFLRDTVEGTYSGYGSTRNYGYAFSLNNLYDTRFEDVAARGNWGVFGSNNLSHTYLEGCDLDRFDIHCYGRDAWLKRCTLRQRQTQFSSMYGTVKFDSCRFVDCIPVRIRSSYNAYTPFDIEMNDCTFELTPRYHSLVNVMLLDTADNPRPELKEKCWPNLRVNRMTVVVPWTVGAMNLFQPTGTRAELRRRFGYISEVYVGGMRMVRPDGREVEVPLHLWSREFQTYNALEYTIER